MTCRYLVESAADITYEHGLFSSVAGFAGVEFDEPIDGVTLP
jgi:hypothetical protein